MVSSSPTSSIIDNSQSQQDQLTETSGLDLDQEGTVMNSTRDEEKKRKRNTVKTVVVDHTYSDYSTYELLVPEKRKTRVTFPMKLHAIMSNPEYQQIIRWMPHGRSWKIIDKEQLASVVCYENFHHDSFGSFARSVNGWGFKRMVGPGPDNGSYYHECFLRGLPDIAQLIARVTTPGKKVPNPNGEPDFHDISKRFPLPEDPNVEHGPPSLDCRDTKRQRQTQQLSITPDEISSTELGYLQMYPNVQRNWQYPHVPPSPPYPNVHRVGNPPNGHVHTGPDQNSKCQGEDAAAKARYGEYAHDLNYPIQLQPRFSSSAQDFQFQPIQTNHDRSLTPITAWASEFSLDAENEYLYDESLFPSGATSIRSTPVELGNGALTEDFKAKGDFKSERSNQGDWSEYLTELAATCNDKPLHEEI